MAIDHLTDIAPELAGEDEKRLERFIEMASRRVSARVFGKLYPDAVVYLAAHLITVSNRAKKTGTAGAGPVQQVRTGGTTIAFGGGGNASAAGDEALNATPYGQEYLAIRNSRALTKGILLR